MEQKDQFQSCQLELRYGEYSILKMAAGVERPQSGAKLELDALLSSIGAQIGL